MYYNLIKLTFIIELVALLNIKSTLTLCNVYLLTVEYEINYYSLLCYKGMCCCYKTLVEYLFLSFMGRTKCV